MFNFFQSKYITDGTIYISVLLFSDTVVFVLSSAYETWEAQTATCKHRSKGTQIEYASSF
jgi:hypothetical protein